MSEKIKKLINSLLEDNTAVATATPFTATGTNSPLAYNSPLWDKLRTQYDVSDNRRGTTILKHKTGTSFPFRIVSKDGGHYFILSKGWSGKTYFNSSWMEIGKFDHVDGALNKIISLHNRASSYMNWPEITEASTQPK